MIGLSKSYFPREEVEPLSTSATERRQNRKHERLHNLGAEEFWAFSSHRFALRDSERLAQIKNGFPAHLFQAMRRTFDLQEHALSVLFNTSMTTLERRIREHRARPWAGTRQSCSAKLKLVLGKSTRKKKYVCQVNRGKFL